MKTNKISKPKGYFPRHLARSVAKAEMKRAGFSRVNCQVSAHWRDYVK